MLKESELIAILKGSTVHSVSHLVSRLLTPENCTLVSGGNYGQCGSSNPGHSMNGGSYRQTGGGYTQDGGRYDMTCPAPPSPEIGF